MSITYLLSSIAVIIVLGYLALLVVWEISKNKEGLLLTNMKEGTGTFFMDGGKAGEIILAMKGYVCEMVEETRPIYDNEGNKIGEKTLQREKIIEGEQRYSPGIFGGLEQHYGIYWVGLPPKSRMSKMFKWNEWKEAKTKEGELIKDEDGKTVMELVHREELTNFFFAQTFHYGIVLKEAETGGTKEAGKDEIGGNLSVDVEIDLFLRIIYPRIALFRNEDWFSQIGSTALDHARHYVGTHPFEKLRAQAEAPKDKPTHNEFSEYVMKLNEYASIGENYEGIVDAFGAKIIGAQIRTVALSGESKKRADATTMVYAAEQKKLADTLEGEGEASKITSTENALTTALTARITAVKNGGDAGALVLNAQAIIEAARHGNTVIANGSVPFILNTNKSGG